MSRRAGRHTPPAGAQGPAAPYRSVGRAGCPLVRGHEDTARAHGSPLGSVRRAHSYGDVSVASVPAHRHPAAPVSDERCSASSTRHPRCLDRSAGSTPVPCARPAPGARRGRGPENPAVGPPTPCAAVEALAPAAAGNAGSTRPELRPCCRSPAARTRRARRRRHTSCWASISVISASIRFLISSRIGRTASTPLPAGSSRVQSRYFLPGKTGQVSPQPMVMT